MPKFIVQMIDVYTGKVMETEDEVFDNEQDAEDYACECGCNFAAGAEVLDLMGRSFIPPQSVNFIVEELDEE